MNEQLYLQIAENVDKNFQTAPKAGDELSQAFIAYLKIVYTPEQAEVVQHMFMFPVFKTLEEVADAAGNGPDAVQNILTPLIAKGFIIASRGGYCIPAIPNLLNLHMFYPDVKPEDQEAARLYQQFFIEEKYYRYYATSEKGTPGLRAIPIEETIDPEEKTFTAEEEEKVVVDAEKCIGCGVCAIACPTETLKLHRMDRPEKPFDTDVAWYMTVAQDNNRL